MNELYPFLQCFRTLINYYNSISFFNLKVSLFIRNILPNISLSHKYRRNILNEVIGKMISKTANIALRKILHLEDNRRTL